MIETCVWHVRFLQRLVVALMPCVVFNVRSYTMWRAGVLTEGVGRVAGRGLKSLVGRLI